MSIVVTLTYDDSLSRVQVDCTGLPSAVDVALVERSTDQARWTTVRGASEWPCSAGAFVRVLHDAEFTPGVVNYYRVRGIDTAGPTFISAGGSVTSDGTDLNPGGPPGCENGDTIYIFASTRNSGVGTVDTPTDWTAIAAAGNVKLLGRRYDGVWSMPTVTFTGDAVGDTNLARAFAFRNVGVGAHNSATQLNGSAQDIAVPALAISEDQCMLLVLGWKQDDWTGVDPLVGLTEIAEVSSTLGNDAGQVIDYGFQGTALATAAQSFVVTGGAAAISRSMILALSALGFLVEQTSSITPVITRPWLKSPARPYLNMPVRLGKLPDSRHASRSTSLAIINRSDPVTITDLRASPAFDLPVRTLDDTEAQRLRNLLAGGDVLLLQVPPDSRYQTRYVAVGDVAEGVLGAALVRHWLLPCQTSAPPEADVIGVTSTCDTILNDFATCAAVLAAFATCVDLMEYVAAPSDVIVP